MNAKRKAKTFFAVISLVSFFVYNLVNLKPSGTGVLSTRELCINKFQNLRLQNFFLNVKKAILKIIFWDNYKIMFEVIYK